MALPTKKSKKPFNMNRSNIMMYGPPGIGKSTFFSGNDKSLAVMLEDGGNHLQIYERRINTWKEFLTTVTELQNEKHNFETIVIDRVETLYDKCEQYCCERENARTEGKEITDPSDVGFGKLYKRVKREFFDTLNDINYMGYGIHFIAHDQTATVKKKTLEYTTRRSGLGEKAHIQLSGLCDFVFYAYSSSEGKLMIKTKPEKYVDAKDRTGLLPKEMELKVGKNNYEIINKRLIELTSDKKGE